MSSDDQPVAVGFVRALEKMGPLLQYGTLIDRKLQSGFEFLGLKAPAAAEVTAAVFGCQRIISLIPRSSMCTAVRMSALLHVTDLNRKALEVRYVPKD